MVRTTVGAGVHELGIATELLELVVRTASEHHMTAVQVVDVRIGRLRQIVPDFLDTAWQALRSGSIAQGAELRVDIQEARARCRRCDRVYDAQPDSFLCPRCQQADYELLEGDEILLMHIEGEAENHAD